MPCSQCHWAKTIFTVCGHSIEANGQCKHAAGGFLSRTCCVAVRPQWVYGWCPGCEEYYRPADLRNEAIILNYWWFKNEHAWWSQPTDPSHVPGAVLFDTSPRDQGRWPATADLAPFMRALDATLGLTKRDAGRLLSLAERIRAGTLEWAQGQSPGGSGGRPGEAKGKAPDLWKPLPLTPEKEVPRTTPSTANTEAALRLCLTLLESPHGSHPTPFLDLYRAKSPTSPFSRPRHSPSPPRAPPRAVARLAACRVHGEQLDADCEECDRILLPEEIAVAPGSSGRDGGAELIKDWEELACAVQPACFCEFYGEQERCQTCDARGQVHDAVGGGMLFI